VKDLPDVRVALVAAGAAALLVACASVPPRARGAPHPAPGSAPGAAGAPPPSDGRGEVGLASYYSDRLAGHRTASGERYDPGAFTAAHRTLRFGTLAIVGGADGRSVVVRITDRGPFVDGRIIDLSRRAAESLGMIRAGTLEVKVTALPPGTTLTPGPL
jgi:rare lipoprotein A